MIVADPDAPPTDPRRSPAARLRGAGRPRRTSRSCSRIPDGSSRTRSSTSTSTPVVCSSARGRCGTRTSGWARSPTRTSATCSRWVRTTGPWTASASRTGSRSACGSAAIILAAALGVLFLFRTLRLTGPGAPVGALVFMLCPTARVRRPALGAPAAVGGAAVDARAADPHVAARGVAPCRALRAARPGHRQRERDRARVRGARTAAVDPVRRLRRPARSAPARAGHDRRRSVC